MIKLQQSEISIVPGANAPLSPPQTRVGQNFAVLQIDNTTNYENAYDITVSCENPLWRQEWVRIYSLLQTDSYGNVSQPSKQDVPLYDGGIRVFVTNRGQRQVVLAFEARKQPDSRAGRYPLQVKVRTSIPDGATGATSTEEHVSVDAYVEPFYHWSSSIEPEQQRVGVLKKRAQYDVKLVNRGNDWLYCCLNPVQQGQEVQTEMPTRLVAVPPPVLGEEESVRVVPLNTTSRIKTLKGSEVVKPIVLNAARLDAPSIPQCPQGDPMASRQDRVMMEETGAPPTFADAAYQPSLVYCPPLKSFLTGSFGWIINNIKAIAFTALGLLAALVAYTAVMDAFVRSVKVEPLQLEVSEPARVLTLGGRFLDGGQVRMFTSNNQHVPESLPIIVNIQAGKGVQYDPNRDRTASESARGLLNRLTPGHTKVWHIAIDRTNWSRLQNEDNLRIRVVRASPLAALFSGMLTYECKTEVNVKKSVVKPPPDPPKVMNPLSGVKGVGQVLTSKGSNFGSQRGVVFFGGDFPAPIVSWRDNQVSYKVPEEMEGQSGIEIQITPCNSINSVSAGVISIAQRGNAGPPPPISAFDDGGGSSGGSGSSSGPSGRPATRPGGRSGGSVSVAPVGPAPIDFSKIMIRPIGGMDAYYALLDGDYAKARNEAGSDAAGKAIQSIALFLDDSGNDELAGKLAREADRLAKSSSNARARALALVAMGFETEQAVPCWNQAIAADKKLLLPYKLLANRLQAMRLTNQAAAIRSKAKSSVPESDAQWEHVDW